MMIDSLPKVVTDESHDCDSSHCTACFHLAKGDIQVVEDEVRKPMYCNGGNCTINNPCSGCENHLEQLLGN